MTDDYEPANVSAEPITTPPAGEELCYECDGKRVCWSCHGRGARLSGARCGQCVGRGWCIVCNGAGTLPEGTEASVDKA